MKRPLRFAPVFPILGALALGTFLIPGALGGCGVSRPVLGEDAPRAPMKKAALLPPVGDGQKSFAGLAVDLSAPGGNRFVGSWRCRECHPDDYQAWRHTLHAVVVQDAKGNPEVVKGDFSAPDLPFTRAEVEFTIGSHWDQRYLTPLGGEFVVLPRKWSVTSRVWEPYNVWSWKKRPYAKNCAGCHMTWFDPARRTIAEPGVGCEACHGPGGKHCEDELPSTIVNPARLGSYLRDMVCAACHVRGTDPSGEYYFPIGFIPGMDLSPLLVVNEKDRRSGEDSTTSIIRVFKEWKKTIEENARGRCDQCGIKVGNMSREQKDSIKKFCFNCHDFGERESTHTHHPAEVPLTCYDCHVKRENGVETQAEDTGSGLRKKVVEGNVHSDSLFRVHIPNCYEPDLTKACVACHKGGKTPGQDAREWARDILNTWKKPVSVGH